MTYEHLILTRFNLQYEADDTIQTDPQWLEKRCQLFENHCLPSLQAQTCQDFTWLLLSDIHTPQRYKSRLAQYAAQFPQIRVVETGVYENLNDFYQAIGRQYALGKDLLISSRIDSDDRFDMCYVETVQRLAKTGVRGYISFPKGRQIFLRDNRQYEVRHVPNHFVSLVEETDFCTVLGINHVQIPLENIYVAVTDTPMWDELVHDSNMLNNYTPTYQYTVRDIGDICDLSKRWSMFQMRRLWRFFQRLVKPSGERK